MKEFKIFVLLIVLLISCGDKERTNQEKIIGTWIGYNGDDATKSNSDTFVFNNNTFYHYTPNGRIEFNNYSLSNGILQYQNGNKVDSLFEFIFKNDNSLILDPSKYQIVIGLDPKFYLTKK